MTCCVVFTALAPVSADEAPAARAYMDWLESAMLAIQRDLPGISDAAESVADAIVAGAGLGVRGDPGLASELSDRVGGFLFLSGDGGNDGDVVLYALGIATADHPEVSLRLDKQLEEVQALRDAGSNVVAFASKSQLRTLGKLNDRA